MTYLRRNTQKDHAKNNNNQANYSRHETPKPALTNTQKGKSNGKN